MGYKEIVHKLLLLLVVSLKFKSKCYGCIMLSTFGKLLLYHTFWNQKASQIAVNRLVCFSFSSTQKCPILNRSARLVLETIPIQILKTWQVKREKITSSRTRFVGGSESIYSYVCMSVTQAPLPNLHHMYTTCTPHVHQMLTTFIHCIGGMWFHTGLNKTG